ncbi:phage holin family protein [Gaiella sp.]|jgi:uncharacterized membrane protein YqjE|uniref:phage holin family protein n=1 Tax=Gaiella sp. TaxID=2663207 RepID=UPI002BD33721|nr:phage holin family protein [Gaiella sp.]HWO81117.1 phage holin family protein [Gaiella sp.]
MAAVETNGRSTGELVKDLSNQVSLLARQEIELAKAEMAEKGRRAGLGLGLVAAAGVSALLALGTLTACVVLALDGAMPAWLAALIVALAWSVVAAVLASVGKQKMEQAGTPVPEQTVESVKEDIKWLKDQTR